MRFGKKLALQVTEDQSGAPYLSHKAMKEAINKTVRELRLYQSKMQGVEQAWKSGGVVQADSEVATQEELSELQVRVAQLDEQLFALVDEDLSRILDHIRNSEELIEQLEHALQLRAGETGLLMEEAKILQLEQALPVVPESRTVLCQQLLELWLRNDPQRAGADLEEIAQQYNELVEIINGHTQYLEINVAGFRKLLKRHEKQIPQDFHARHTPFLGFHRLVTRTSRQLLEIARQFGAVLEDAWQRLCRIHPSAGALPELQELKELGAECKMVLEIQKQLKDPMQSGILGLGGGGQHEPGFLYPKPGAEMTGGPTGGHHDPRKASASSAAPAVSSTNRGGGPAGALYPKPSAELMAASAGSDSRSMAPLPPAFFHAVASQGWAPLPQAGGSAPGPEQAGFGSVLQGLASPWPVGGVPGGSEEFWRQLGQQSQVFGPPGGKGGKR